MQAQDYREPWWGKGLNFSCTACGACCGGAPGVVYFTASEESAMAASLGIGAEEFRSLYVWRRYGEPSLRERANYDCVFLRRNPCVCAVYESRPSQCREFPFWPDVLKSRSSWDRFAVACPGMNHGDFHPHGEIISSLERQFGSVIY